MINDGGSFESYQWTDVFAANFDFLNGINDYIPNGMKIIIPCQGIHKNLIDIVGFNNL